MGFRKLYICIISLLVISFSITSCSDTEKPNQPRDKSVEENSSERQNQSRTAHLDTSSAPLYRATKKAKVEDLNLELLDGSHFQLSDQRGNVVLLNIWATWCKPCHEETPDLVHLYNKYHPDGFTILGVSVDEQSDSKVRDFVKQYNIPYPIYIDKKDKVREKYGPYMAIPTTFIIDQEGYLEYYAAGAVTQKELEPRIRKMLGKEHSLP